MYGKGVSAVAAVVLSGIFLSCVEGSCLDQDALSCCRCHDDSQTLLCPHECQPGYYRSGQLPLGCSDPEMNKREKRAAEQQPEGSESKSSDNSSKSSETQKHAEVFPVGQSQPGSKPSEGKNDSKPSTIHNNTAVVPVDPSRNNTTSQPPEWTESKPTERNNDSKPPTIHNNTAVVPVDPSRHNTTSQPPEWTKSKPSERNNDSKSSEIPNNTTTVFPTNTRQSSASTEASPAALTAVACLPCHSTCKECAGPGKDNCTECPADNELIASEPRFRVGLCQPSHEDREQLILTITSPLLIISFIGNVLLGVGVYKYIKYIKYIKYRRSSKLVSGVPAISVPPYSRQPSDLPGSVSVTALSGVVDPQASNERRSTDDQEKLCPDNQRNSSAKQEKVCLTSDNSPDRRSSAQNRSGQSPLDSTNDGRTPNHTHRSGRRRSSGYSSRPPSSKSATAGHADEDLCHRVGPSLSVLPGSTHLWKSSSSQSLPSLDNIPLPFIHTCWQYKKEISFNGGVVQRDHSDVCLDVPKGAIERGDSVMIHEAVGVNLQSACAKLQVPENEVIVSPVAEFYAGEGFVFRKPVCIVLPHLLPPGVTERDIQVYQFSCDESGQPQLEKLQYKNSDHPQTSNPVTAGTVGTYCFGEGSTVHIFVDHFSGVFCTKCKSDCYLPDLWLELYGQYSHISGMKAEVGLVLKIWDTDIEDFKQDDADKDSLNLSKMKKIDGKMLPALEICGDRDTMREVESTDLSVRLELPSHDLQLEWMHETRDDGQHGENHAYPPEESFRLKKFVVCDKHKAKRCQRKDWSLVNKAGVTPGDVFTCFVDAGYVKTDGAHVDTSRQLNQTSRKITFKVRISPDTLGHNAGDSASGVAKETNCGSTEHVHDSHNVTSHETQRKFSAGDPGETLRKGVCQTEAYQRPSVSFGSTKIVNIVLQNQSREGTGYSNTQSHPGREHLSDRSQIHVSPSSSSSLSTPRPGHQGPMSYPARERSSSENTQTSPNDSSAATGDESRRLTLTGRPCEPDSSSLPSSTTLSTKS